MIGNRQFAENRINDDDLISATTASGCHSQQKDLSSPDSNIARQPPQDLDLSSILLKAFELIPKDDHHQYDVDYNHEQELSESNSEHSINVAVVASEINDGLVEAGSDVNQTIPTSSDMNQNETNIRPEESPQPIISPKVDVIVAGNNEEASIQDKLGDTVEYCSQKLYDSQQTKNLDIRSKPDVGPVNKDRVAEILKRYSLYDDDEDDDEDDNGV